MSAAATSSFSLDLNGLFDHMIGVRGFASGDFEAEFPRVSGILADIASARAMLEALPLSTDQFHLARSRLQNALHYLRYTEPGAAWYELRLLASSLKNAESQVCEPNRRLRRRC